VLVPVAVATVGQVRPPARESAWLLAHSLVAVSLVPPAAAATQLPWFWRRIRGHAGVCGAAGIGWVAMVSGAVMPSLQFTAAPVVSAALPPHEGPWLSWMHTELALIEAHLPSERTTAAGSSDC
jgi:hypothetical protein